MKRQEWLCNTRAASLSRNPRHKLLPQHPFTTSSPFAPKQSHYSLSTVYLILARRRCFRGPWRVGIFALTCLLKVFSHVSAACCPTHSSFQAKWAALVSLAPSSIPQLSPGAVAARRYLQTMVYRFRSLLEQISLNSSADQETTFKIVMADHGNEADILGINMASLRSQEPLYTHIPIHAHAWQR